MFSASSCQGGALAKIRFIPSSFSSSSPQDSNALTRRAIAPQNQSKRRCYPALAEFRF